MRGPSSLLSDYRGTIAEAEGGTLVTKTLLSVENVSEKKQEE